MNMRTFRGFLLMAFCALGFQAEVAAQDFIYKARDGDTLWDLCLKYTNKSNCWLILGEYNGIDQVKAISVGSEIRIPQSWLITRPVVGQAIGVTGEVLYLSKAGGTLVPLVAGQSLILGSTVVARQGSARISLGKISSILIRQNTELVLNSLSAADEPGVSTELDLNRGGIELEIEPRPNTRFEIRTPSAIAAVRGTSYRLTVQDDLKQPTRTEVITGAVSIQSVGKALVPAGFGVLAEKDKPLSEPRALLAPPEFESTSVESSLPILITWKGNPSAVAWQLDLREGAGNSVPIASYRTVEPELLISDLAPACYQLRARAIDSEGFQGLDSQLPLCVLPTPEKVVVEEPDSHWVETLIATVFFIIILF